MTWLERFGRWQEGYYKVTDRYKRINTLYPLGIVGDIRQKELSQLAKPWAEMMNAAATLLKTHTPSPELYKGQNSQFWFDGLEIEYDTMVDIYNDLSDAYQQQKLDDEVFLLNVMKNFQLEVEDWGKYLKMILFVGIALVALRLISFVPKSN